VERYLSGQEESYETTARHEMDAALTHAAGSAFGDAKIAHLNLVISTLAPSFVQYDTHMVHIEMQDRICRCLPPGDVFAEMQGRIDQCQPQI
jgi:hypothetical protein